MFHSTVAMPTHSALRQWAINPVSQKHHRTGTAVMFALADVSSLCVFGDSISRGHNYTQTGCQVWGSWWDYSDLLVEARKQEMFFVVDQLICKQKLCDQKVELACLPICPSLFKQMLYSNLKFT